MVDNDRINVRNIYIELLNKLKEVEGVDIHYIDHLVALLEQDMGLIETDVNFILSLIPTGASTENKLATSNDIPVAQVNSDWNASSGVAQILNKPSLATVATSGSYEDLTNKPTIPAAQVNSDWNASSGVAQILNKPTIPVITSEFTTLEVDIEDWYQTSGQWYCPINLYGYQIDTTKLYIINLIPSSSSAHVPTNDEKVAYSRIKYVTAENYGEPNPAIRLEIYSETEITDNFKIQFSFWKLL